VPLVDTVTVGRVCVMVLVGAEGKATATNDASMTVPPMAATTRLCGGWRIEAHPWVIHPSNYQITKLK